MAILIGTIPLNFYALITLVVVLYTIISGKVYGPMRKSEQQLHTLSHHSEIETAAQPPGLYAGTAGYAGSGHARLYVVNR
ncbi:hypothetical protein [Arsukibacterium sp.]|uniref:hypothetical protein n=1 Tax=Arsukibacterium sp. TaxID=1977258 RepID=UPI002635FD61|nr:hypothetical protein [Arsukibacterium sp.]